MRSKPPIKKPKYKPGQTFGNLTIIAISNKRTATSRKRFYDCICACGKKITKPSDYFIRNSFTSCGCLDPRKEADRENAMMKRLFKDKISSKHYLNKGSDLSFSDFKEIIKKPCIYCGIGYSMQRKDIIRGRVFSDVVLKYNGIDRVDNNQGYTLKNSAPCCSTCNMAKRTMPKDEFISWIKRIYEFNFKRKRAKKIDGQLVLW